MDKGWAGWSCLSGGGLLVARLAGATTVIAHSFSTLVQEVEVIAVGTVTAIETEWDAQQGAPFTLVTFSELTVLKGEGGQANCQNERVRGGRSAVLSGAICEPKPSSL